MKFLRKMIKLNLSGFNLHIDFEREVFYYGETYLWKEWASTF